MQIMTMLYYRRIVLISVELRRTSGGRNRKFHGGADIMTWGPTLKGG